MNREQKTAVVEEIGEQIRSSEAIFAVDYRGITVAQVADLRDRLREADARFRVVKNSLSELAADAAGAGELKPMLQGPTALALVKGDAALAAKALSDVGRAINLLEFKGGLLNGAPLSADDVRSIARLPSRDVLNAQLVGTIAAPISGVVRGLNALIAGIAIQLQAIADQGLVSGIGDPAVEASAASAAETAEADSDAPAGEAEADAPADAAQNPDASAEPETPDAWKAAEQPVEDPDSEPHDAPVQPSQAEGEDTPQEDN